MGREFLTRPTLQSLHRTRVLSVSGRGRVRVQSGTETPSSRACPCFRAVKDAGFGICADELGSIVEGHNLSKLKDHGGVEGIADKLSTSLDNGISVSAGLFNYTRRNIYGINNFAESPAAGFCLFVWKALQSTTLMMLAVYVLVILIVPVATRGWAKVAHDAIGIVASILLVVFVIAVPAIDYKQSLKFKELEKKKKKIKVRVTRNGNRQRISIIDLLPGDVVYLSIGDQVPADGLFVSGYSLLINESSLTGESDLVNVTAENPFLLSGTEVQDGSCKMLVTAVGMRTQWGKLMATPSEGGECETPLLDKLNGMAHIIGKIVYLFAVVAFSFLVVGLFTRKMMESSVMDRGVRELVNTRWGLTAN